MRGYFGIGIYHYMHECNVGTLYRSAYAFGATFIFTIGRKYKKQNSDTSHTDLHIPYYDYLSTDDFVNNLPKGCQIVCIELNEKSRPLSTFCHPERAVYLLGNETDGIPEKFMNGRLVVQIPSTKICLNVSTAGSIVMYDRISKNFVKEKIVCNP